MRLAWAEVRGVLSDEGDIQRLEVALDDGQAGLALCYPALTGPCRPGDSVWLNTTAVDLSLGTGGFHFVVAIDGGPGPSGDRSSGGRIMKARYTPLQVDVACVEEQDSEHHAMMAAATGLTGMPVVCCGLHSQVPHAAAGARSVVPDAKVAYVMTDHAALPMALSELVRASRAAGLIDVTITCGQAFGGALEAVTLHSALLAARHVAEADVAVVAGGPGIVGTATPYGHGGIAQGEAVNAAACLGGVPVAALRLSFADERERHRGVSHHTLTALGRVAVARCLVAVPRLPDDRGAMVDEALSAAGVWERHERREVDVRLEEMDTGGVEPRTMGRGVTDDGEFFLAAAAAGCVAGGIIRGQGRVPGPENAKEPR